MGRLLALLALATLALPASSAVARPSGGAPVALVTAETQNQLIAISFFPKRILRRVTLPADPQNVVANQKVVVVVSPGSGVVSLLGAQSLRVTKILRGFGAPHLAALAPLVCPDDRPPCRSKWAYVTDDARGQLAVISLQQKRVVKRLFVGGGAHHLSVSPGGKRLWIALGERARRIAIVDVSRQEHPRLLRRFDPGFVAHDVAFSPNGRRVWVTSSEVNRLMVFDSETLHPIASIAAGAPPQHVVFGPTRPATAYITSGYAGRIVAVKANGGRILRVGHVPYGSFNLATAGSFVITTSLLNGTVTELGPKLAVWRSVTVAPAARGVATVVWPQ